jgi:hypothetical protein
MNLKNTKNLLIIAALAVGVLSVTVLLANYTNVLSASSDTGSQPKACQATASAYCPASIASSAENAKVECAQKAECGSVAKTCPADPTKPCCAQEVSNDCPVDCAKPCCAGEAKPACCTSAVAETVATNK